MQKTNLETFDRNGKPKKVLMGENGNLFYRENGLLRGTFPEYCRYCTEDQIFDGNGNKIIE